ncbi:hypothetical protein [Azospirillum doebereinerae]
MAKPSNQIAKMLNRRTDLGKARAIMGLASVCGTAFQMNALLGESTAIYGNTYIDRSDEAKVRELVKALISGFDKVDPSCTDTTINMVADALNHDSAPITPRAVEFLRAEFLRIAHVAEGLARGLSGEKMPLG